MARMYRELSDEIKKKISDSMQQYHKQMTYDEKTRINKLKSASQKRYWEGIPSKKNEQNNQDQQ